MVTYGFFNSVSGDRKYNAEQLSEFFGGLVGNGIFENVGQRFVIQAESNNLVVSVGTGRAFINSHWVKNDAKFILNLENADVQYPRIDAIVIKLDENSRTVDIHTKKGTAANNPQPPTLTRSNGVYELCLARVYVAAGATSISQTNITDTRANSALCGWVTGLIDQVDTEDLFLQWDAAYEAQYQKQTNEFNEWFDTLTQRLNVNTKLVKYKNTIITSNETNEINIGIPQYKQDDILLVHVGGVLFVEGDEYKTIGEGETAKIKLTNTLKAGNPVTFVVIKSQVGGTGSVQGTRFNFSATFTSDGVLKNTTSTETLDAGSFATGQTDIVTVFVADNVTKIDNGAFIGCTSLKTIYIDNTVSNVEIVSGAIPDGVSIVYLNDDNFINVNELLASAIKSLKTNTADEITKLKNQANTDRQNFNNSVDEINTTLDTKEKVSNKVSEITFPSLDYYPSSKAVFDYVNSKISTPLADIESLKSNKLDKNDFNTYKTATDKAIADNTKSINANVTAIDKCVTDIANNSALISKNQINVTTDKSTSIVLNDSSDCNIVDLVLYGNSIQSAVPTPTAPANIDNVTNSQIKLYRKNLFDFKTAVFNENGNAKITKIDRENKTVSFVTSATSVSSGIYIRNKDGNFGTNLLLLQNKKLTLSFDIVADKEIPFLASFMQPNWNVPKTVNTAKQRLSVTDTVDNIMNAMTFYVNNQEANITISNIQIEVDSIATDYEVCDVNKVEINCTLCKVNNIADTLTVNADGTGYITQNLLYERITSGRSQSGHTWRYSTTSKRFYRDDTRYKANGGTPNLLCSHFEVKDNERDVTLDNSIGFTSGSGAGVAIRMLQFDGDISAFENWLDNNEVYILIPLKQQIITELSKEQVDKILSLHTYYPSTTIIADCDCQVEYVADTKNYIDNKFNELATAIVAHESEVN